MYFLYRLSIHSISINIQGGSSRNILNSLTHKAHDRTQLNHFNIR